MNYEMLGKNIRRERQHANMTQEALAAKAAISASFLGHIERGSRKASLETLVSLCNALDAGADILLAGNIHPVVNDVPESLLQDIVAAFQRHNKSGSSNGAMNHERGRP